MRPGLSGGFVGLFLGTGIGVAVTATAHGAPFNPGPAFIGATSGGLLSLPVTYIGTIFFGSPAPSDVVRLLEPDHAAAAYFL